MEISGAISYSLLKESDGDKRRRVIIFFDNHVDRSYCSEQLPYFVSNWVDDTKSTLIAEIPPKTKKWPKDIVSSPYNAPHTRQRPLSSNVVPSDIRFGTLLQANTHTIEDLIQNTETYIQARINKSNVLKNHGKALLRQMLRIPKNDRSSTELGSYLLTPLSVIDGRFPFTRGTAITSQEIMEEILSSAMEFACIANLLESTNRTNTLYLGAAHAFRVHYLLENHYKWTVVRHHGHSEPILALEELNNLQNCVRIPF